MNQRSCPITVIHLRLICFSLMICCMDQSLHGETAVSFSVLNDQTLQGLAPDNEGVPDSAKQIDSNPEKTSPTPKTGDRIWLLNTRHLISRASQVNLDSPAFKIYQLDSATPAQAVERESFLEKVSERRKSVIYIHGNRFTADDAIERGCLVHEKIATNEIKQPIDWIIWSWASDKKGVLVHDARLKANRTEGQGLYLAWLLKEFAKKQIPTTLIGYSFGGRIVTGALHAAAGGKLGGVSIKGEPTVGAPFNAALIAPAIDSLWLDQRGYHRLAPQNLDSLTLLYNRRDAILKRYWRIDQIQGRLALGLTGPRSFAPRHDGSLLPVRSHDCSDEIGMKHDELYYFHKSCHAGRDLARLINQQPSTQ